MYADGIGPVEREKLVMPEKGDNCRSKILEKRRWHRTQSKYVRIALLQEQRYFIDFHRI